jgi:hypothetical protein
MANRLLVFVGWILSGLSFTLALAGLTSPGAGKFISLAFFGWSAIFAPPLYRRTIKYGLSANIISRVIALFLLPIVFTSIALANGYVPSSDTAVKEKSAPSTANVTSPVSTPRTNQNPATPSITPVAPAKVANSSPLTVASPSPMRTDYTKSDRFEDVSIGPVGRYAIGVFIPLGRSREEVSATLDRAARELAAEKGAKAVIAFGYRPGDPTDGMYTIGKATYAPSGDWSKARSDEPMKVTIELGTLYFATKALIPSTGDIVTLTSDVYLSKNAESWLDEDTVGTAKNGSLAKVLEVRIFPNSMSEGSRIRIKMLSGDRAEGWIHGFDIASKK